MIKNIDTIQKAAEEMVNSMNAFPRDMLEALYSKDDYDWEIISPLREGQRVYCRDLMENGDVESVDRKNHKVSVILEDSGETAVLSEDSVIPDPYYNEFFPMWGTLWQFRDDYMNEWVKDNIDAVAACGFSIYESKKYGIFLGVDGAGYNFLKEHFIPLYQASPLDWTGEKQEAKESESDYEME